MTRSGIRRSADAILVVAVAAAISVAVMLWMRGDWRPGLPLWPLVWDYLLQGWLYALRTLCIAVMAYAAIQALTTDRRPTRLVWAALVIALCSELVASINDHDRLGSLVSRGLEEIIPSAALEATVIVMVFLLARLAITRSGRRRSADVVLVIAVAAGIAHIAVRWVGADYQGDGSLLWSIVDRTWGSGLYVLRMLCVAVMAHAAIRALSAGQQPMRLVWGALVVALCGALTARTVAYFRWEWEPYIPAAFLDAAVIVVVFLLARLVILRAGSGRETGDALNGEHAADDLQRTP